MGMLENLMTVGGTIIAGGLLLKATDIMFQKPRGRRMSLYDMANRTKSIHQRAKRKTKRVI